MLHCTPAALRRASTRSRANLRQGRGGSVPACGKLSQLTKPRKSKRRWARVPKLRHRVAPDRVEPVLIWEPLYACQLAHGEVANATICKTQGVAPTTRTMQPRAERAGERINIICHVPCVLTCTPFQSVAVHAVRFAQITKCLAQRDKI